MPLPQRHHPERRLNPLEGRNKRRGRLPRHRAHARKLDDEVSDQWVERPRHRMLLWEGEGAGEAAPAAPPPQRRPPRRRVPGSPAARRGTSQPPRPPDPPRPPRPAATGGGVLRAERGEPLRARLRVPGEFILIVKSLSCRRPSI